MQYLLGLSKFTEKPVFVPELFVLIRKRLDQDFFNMLTLILSRSGRKQTEERIVNGNTIRPLGLRGLTLLGSRWPLS